MNRLDPDLGGIGRACRLRPGVVHAVVEAYDAGSGTGRSPGELAHVLPDMGIGRAAGGWRRPEQLGTVIGFDRWPRPRRDRFDIRRLLMRDRLAEDDHVWRCRAADDVPLVELAAQAGVPVEVMREFLGGHLV